MERRIRRGDFIAQGRDGNMIGIEDAINERVPRHFIDSSLLTEEQLRDMFSIVYAEHDLVEPNPREPETINSVIRDLIDEAGIGFEHIGHVEPRLVNLGDLSERPKPTEFSAKVEVDMNERLNRRND